MSDTTSNNETVCPAQHSPLSYPEVFPGATDWLWSDADPHKRITVTAHGLRRLLRLIARIAAADIKSVLDALDKGPPDGPFMVPRQDELMNEASSIHCEGDLVVSRLFVSEDGREIRHPEEEVDATAVAAITSAKEEG